MLSKNLLTPWTIDLFGRPVMVRQPHWTKRVWPAAASISRQISFERSANGEYSTPSPTAARVNLVSPADDPNSCGGLKRSIPRTFVPSRAKCHVAALPTAPRPTTITSYDGMARVVGSLAFSRDRSPLRLWPACNARRFYAQRPLPPLDTSDEWGPKSQCGPMKKSRFGDRRLQKAFPPHLPPETDKQIGRQGDHCWRA